MSALQPKIAIRGLTKSFGKKQVLRGVDLDLQPGQSLVVIGGSGTGKSVMLKCILGLLALYLFVIGRCLWIAAEAKDTYSRLLAGALAMSFFVYVMVNGGMITGLLPVVGVPLPLVSYGGTSAVSLLTGFGVLMAIHGQRKTMR